MTLHWGRQWKEHGYHPTHCAALKDEVAILVRRYEQLDELHTSCDLHNWTKSCIPYKHTSLAVYQSKFVLVGGRDPSTHEPTNTILTSTTGQQWELSLPPMPTKHCDTSSVSTRSPEVMVVAGGKGSHLLNVVEVLIDDKWTTVDPLPTSSCKIRSTLHDRNLYFMGGENQHALIYTCSCASLISSCESSSSNTSNRQLWSWFHASDHRTTAVSYSLQLANINRRETVTCYSSKHHSWIAPTSEVIHLIKIPGG